MPSRIARIALVAALLPLAGWGQIDINSQTRGSLAASRISSVVPRCAKYTTVYTNAAFITAGTAVSVTLATLPARAKIVGATIKHSAQFSDGAGAMSQVTASLGDGSTHTAYSAAQNIGEATAVADTTFTDTAQFKSTTHAASSVVARFTATGRDFGSGSATYLTGGSVDIWVCSVVLP